jgi:hypothetical protein
MDPCIHGYLARRHRYGRPNTSTNFIWWISNNSWNGHVQWYRPINIQWISGWHVRPTCQWHMIFLARPSHPLHETQLTKEPINLTILTLNTNQASQSEHIKPPPHLLITSPPLPSMARSQCLLTCRQRRPMTSEVAANGPPCHILWSPARRCSKMLSKCCCYAQILLWCCT